MKSVFINIKHDFERDPWLFALVIAGIVAMSLVILVYIRLGVYSRYLADDYCETLYFRVSNGGELLANLSNRYQRISGRLSNLLFVGFSQLLFGGRSVSILPEVMLVLFATGLFILIREIDQLADLKLGRMLDFFLAVSVAFFSLYQAPNLFQVIYWRSGMATHFAPLVFLLFLGGLVLHHIRLAGDGQPPYWVRAVGFIGFLIAGNFSEPPTTTIITLFVLAIGAVYLNGRIRFRRSALILLTWSLAGALTALLIMALAPALSFRLETPPPGFEELVRRVAVYPLDFIVDTFRTLPVPTLVSVLMMIVLFYLVHTRRESSMDGSRTRFILLLLVVPLLAYLLIAASFAPSAYGQSYPVARARFAGRLLLTIGLMAEGSLLGVWISSWKAKLVRSTLAQVAALGIFALLVLYPLRAAWQTSLNIPDYRANAAAWDARDAAIRAMAAEGQQNLKVRLLPGRYQIKEIDALPNHWVNKCAAQFYNVQTIVSVPMDP